MRVVVALVVWVAAAAGAVALSTVVSNSIGSQKATAATTVPGGFSSVSTTATQSVATPFDASTVRPTDPNSLFRPANFARALAIVRTHVGARSRVELLRLAAGNLIVMYPGGGHNNQVIVNADGSGMIENIGPLDPTMQLFPLSKVNVNVPAALAARIAKFGNSPISKLDYMVGDVEPIANSFRWLVFPVGGGSVHFEAASATGPIQEFSGSGLRTLPG